MAKLKGFSDGELHERIQEALAVLLRAQDAYQHALSSIEGGYLRPLDASYDRNGDPEKRTAECKRLLAQVDAVRELFAKAADINLGGDGVKPRGFATK